VLQPAREAARATRPANVAATQELRERPWLARRPARAQRVGSSATGEDWRRWGPTRLAVAQMGPAASPGAASSARGGGERKKGKE
jgi:hypothetical protein